MGCLGVFALWVCYLCLISVCGGCSLDGLSNGCNNNNRSAMIYFIRHGESRFNVVADQMEAKYGIDDFLDAEEYIAEKFDRKYLDVDLTEKGREDSKNARQKLAGIEVDIVIVSPLRRALETCAIMFEGHKSKAAVIVEPVFRQIMESSNDIGSRLEQSMKEFPTFNFDNIKDKEAWYVHTLHNQKDREEILEKLKGLQGKERSEAAIQGCLKIMKENWAERRGNLQFEQALKVRVLPNYAQQLKVLEYYTKKYSRIAIVAHSQCIKRYAGYKIQNCEIFPFESAGLKLSQQ